MLRFNKISGFFSCWGNLISIHPMLRFNGFRNELCGRSNAFQYILCYGSTDAVYQERKYGRRFQYILCYGSTIKRYVPINIKIDFNTSYVTVQLFVRLVGHSANSISIHPMLRFNFLVIRVGTKLSEFQYILCYGSTRWECCA